MSARKTALVLVGMAFLVRLGVYLGSTLCHGDGPRFIEMMEAFSEARFREGLESWGYHPLYPMIASLFQPLLGSATAGYWVSLVLGSAAAAPLYLFARDILGNPASFFGTFLYVFHRHIVDIQADIATEGTFFFFLFSAIWLGWKTFRKPEWSTALLAGLSASAAFLTRGEGLIAVVGIPLWLIVSSVRGKVAARLVCAMIFLGAAVLPAIPYLNYARVKTGRLSISAKTTVTAAFDSAEVPSRGPADPDDPHHWKKLGRNMMKVTYYVLLPLILLGIFVTRWRWETLFYASFPILYWTALIASSPKLAAASTRYLLPGLALLFPFAVLGLAWIFRRWRKPGLLPWAILALVLVWGGRSLSVKRYEDRPVVEAAEWIAARGGETPVIGMGDTTRTARFVQLAGGKLVPLPKTWDEFEAWTEKADFLVGYEKEDGRIFPAWLPRLREQREASVTFRQKIFRKEKPRVVEVYRLP